MLSKSKKIFLFLCITVPFLIYCVYYYGMMIKNAPYKFVEFESFSFKYGTRDSLLNGYDSKTGQYQYLNDKDSLVKMHLKLSKNDFLYLHRKAADIGFWDFPVDETGDSVKTGTKPLRYVIEFKYKRKSKRVVFDENYKGNDKLIDANKQVIKQINLILSDKEAREKNQ